MVGAGEVLGEGQLASRPTTSITTSPSASDGRGLDRLRQALPEVRLHHQPVDDDLDRVLELLVEDELLLEQPLLAVDLHAGEAVAAQLLEDVLELALAVAHDRAR